MLFIRWGYIKQFGIRYLVMAYQPTYSVHVASSAPQEVRNPSIKELVTLMKSPKLFHSMGREMKIWICIV
jgi:hypothetical protein